MSSHLKGAVYGLVSKACRSGIVFFIILVFIVTIIVSSVAVFIDSFIVLL